MTSPVPGHGIGTPYGVPGSWKAGYHTGNDYPAPAGTPVVATRAGKVTKAQWDGDYGNRVEILTGDVEHSYSHLSKFAVTVGQQVSEGQKIGEVGSTGNSTGPHCHYEERLPPHGYSNDRKPQFDTTTGGGTPPPAPEPPAPSTEEDDMFIAESPGRGAALMGPGYYHSLNPEERDVLMDFGVRLVKHNDRGFDVARAACMQGDADTD